MSKLLTMILILITASSAYALKVQKAYPDYEIIVSMTVIQNNADGNMYSVIIKVKDMIKKQYVKGWQESDSVSDFSLSDTGTITSYKFITNNSKSPHCPNGCIQNTPVYQNYYDSYKVIASDVFKIAKKIQDAGFIPVITYNKFDLINVEGVYDVPTGIMPSGTWGATTP